MAIQNRRGNDADFQPSRLLPGEFAVTMDEKKLYICFTSGTVRQIALTEDLLDEISALSTELHGEITTLTTGASDHLRRIISLEEQMANANSAITSLNTGATDHARRITALEGQATDAATTLSGHESRITALEGDNANTRQRLSTVEGTVSGHTTSVSNLETAMSNAQQGIRELSSSVGTNTGDISNLKGRMTNAEGAITALSTIDPVWTFEVDADGHLIMTQERYDPSGISFALVEGRLVVTYG